MATVLYADPCVLISEPDVRCSDEDVGNKNESKNWSNQREDQADCTTIVEQIQTSIDPTCRIFRGIVGTNGFLYRTQSFRFRSSKERRSLHPRY